MLAGLNPDFWKGKKVFLTGHTGFKGAWLAYWLIGLGAKVTGYALAPSTFPSMYDLLKLDEMMDSVFGDIRDSVKLRAELEKAQPEVVLHLAAQPIVSVGYEAPAETFETNIMGVVHLLDICREMSEKLSILIISSDKCYSNNDEGKAFTINDALGGNDPYSASKAGTEIVVGAYRSSYFLGPNGPVISSARAGNVIGGGDWSVNRLLPDGARAFSAGCPLVLRNPESIRPWQHVIEPLYGYLLLVQAMVSDRSYSQAWNFGPSIQNERSVGQIAQLFAQAWGDDAKIELLQGSQNWKEAMTLNLDCSETNDKLNWRPVLDFETTIEWTANWYKDFYFDMSKEGIRTQTKFQIDEYVKLQSEYAF
jgi:CDP-glucose 4,6-dehydratase